MPPRNILVELLMLAVAVLFQASDGKDNCVVPFREAKSLTEDQLLKVAELAFDGNCKMGEFPGLQRSIDPLCYEEYNSESGCASRRASCQRLISADGSAVLAINDDKLAPIGLYYAKNGLSFQSVVLAKNKKEVDLVKDWAEDSDDEGKKVTTECKSDFVATIGNVSPATEDICGCSSVCMTDETLARVLHMKIRKYKARVVLCHAGNCMTPRHNVLHKYGLETMEDYCRDKECTRRTADVYKAIVFGFARSGGVVLSMVYGTGAERIATAVGQTAVWAVSVAAMLSVYYVLLRAAFRSLIGKTDLSRE